MVLEIWLVSLVMDHGSRSGAKNGTLYLFHALFPCMVCFHTLFTCKLPPSLYLGFLGLSDGSKDYVTRSKTSTWEVHVLFYYCLPDKNR